MMTVMIFKIVLSKIGKDPFHSLVSRSTHSGKRSSTPTSSLI